MPKKRQNRLLTKCDSGKPVVSSNAIYKRLPFANGRHADWIGRCRDKVNQINETLIANPLEHDYQRVGDDYLLSVKTAMAYLLWGPNNYQTGLVRQQLEVESGISLFPNVRDHISRHEDVFAIDLEDTLDGLFPYELTMIRQKKIGGYKVDFYLEPDDAARKRGVGPYIIEFDEAYHRVRMQAERDRERDAEIFHLTGIKVIRVPIDKAELWLDICHQYYGVGVEDILRKWLSQDVDKKGRLYSNTISEYRETDINTWFGQPKTNMQLGQEILDFLGIPYRMGRSFKGRYLELQEPLTFQNAA